MKNQIKQLTIIIAVVTLYSPFSFANWVANYEGYVESIHITGGGNMDLRVVLKERYKLCQNEHDWAYINEHNDNYDSFLSVLLAAQASGRKVKIYTTRDSAGYCKMGYLTIF